MRIYIADYGFHILWEIIIALLSLKWVDLVIHNLLLHWFLGYRMKQFGLKIKITQINVSLSVIFFRRKLIYIGNAIDTT